MYSVASSLMCPLVYNFKVMATVILYLMAVRGTDTVMEATATVMSPNTGMITDMITGIHTEDMAIHMTIPTATVRPQVTLLNFESVLL